MSILPPFPAFEYDANRHTSGQRWLKWVARFENFLIAMDIKDDARKKALLLHYAGESISEIFDNLPDKGTDYAKAIEALNKYFQPKYNTNYEIYVFRQARQQAGETLDQFDSRLRKMAATCNFADIENELKSQLIIGCSSSRLRKHALQTPSEDLGELLAYGLASELSDKHLAEIESITKETVNIISNKNNSRAPSRNRPQERATSSKKKQQCSYCGKGWHTEGLDKCRARGQTCRTCGKINHFATVCKSKQYSKRENEKQSHATQNTVKPLKDKIHQLQSTDDEDTDREYVFTNTHMSIVNTCKFEHSKQKHGTQSTRKPPRDGVLQVQLANKTDLKCAYDNAHTSVANARKFKHCPIQEKEKNTIQNSYTVKPPKAKTQSTNDDDSDREYLYINTHTNQDKQETIDLDIYNHMITFIIDTGATVDILSEADFSKIKTCPTLQQSTKKIYAYGSQTPMKIKGSLPVCITHNNIKHNTEIQISEEKGPSLIGRKTALGLNLIQFIRTLSTESSILDHYEDICKGVGKHKSVKIKLHVDEQVRPCNQKHRRIPFHVREKVAKELLNLEQGDIIEKVPESEPTPWVSPIVVVPKKAAPTEVRICVDMRAANLAIKRERHITPTVDDIIYDLNGAQFFSKLDLAKGYHQFEISPESRSITTFSTHKGLFRYKRLYFGINSAAEIFQNEISKALQGINGVMNISDDILVYGKSQEQHDEALNKTLQRLRQTGLTINKEKCILNKKHLTFFGYTFSAEGMAVDPNKVKTITQMTAPTTPTEVRSFLGMVNFCTRFTPHLADISKPLRELTKKNMVWSWTDEHKQAHEKIKQQITKAVSMAYFDRNLNTEIWTDASPVGLGAILMQRDPNGNSRILAFASHALTDTETRYSQIEREALALTWAINHFRLYLHGAPFTVVTDHKPLVSLFNNPNAQLSARLERWRLKLQQHSFKVTYMPGKENPADYMSRYVTNATGTGSHIESRAEEYANFLSLHASPKAISLDEVQKATLEDAMLQTVIQNLNSGNWKWAGRPLPNESQMPAFKKLKCELSTNKERSVLLRGARLVLPSSLQQRAVNIAHQGHLGIVKTKALVREKTWFPGIDKMIEDTIAQCIECNAVTNTHGKSPLHTTDLPQRPWQKLNIDHKGPLPTGDYLLVIVDQFSRFPVVEIVPSTSAATNIPRLDTIFSTFGIPEEVCSDNGPPFNSREFSEFASTLGFKHRKITPLWPQANGEAERLNRTISKVLQIAEYSKPTWKNQLNQQLRSYRATPHATTGVTPAELLFGYKLQTQLPEIRQLSCPADRDSLEQRDSARKAKSKDYYDAKQKQGHPPPQLGDTVLVRQPRLTKLTTPFRMEPYTVTAMKGDMVTSQRDGHTIVRNQSHFKVIPTVNTETSTSTDTQNIEQTCHESNEMKTGQTPLDKTCLGQEMEGHGPRQDLPKASPGRPRRQRKPPKRLIEEI